MGAASALVAALQRPERIAGLVLYRPPLLWQEREARTRQLEQAAHSLPESAQAHKALLRGAARTNLPPVSDACWARLNDASVPILILCHGEDAVHPVSSGEALKQVLPRATLLVEADQASAERAFPPALASWLRDACVDAAA